MKIKVCGMTTVPNLQSILEGKPDFIGFIFYEKSSRLVTDLEVLDQDMNGAQKVGVFVNEDIEEVQSIQSAHGLDYVQLHGDESPEYCEQLKSKQIKIFKTFSIDNDFDFDKLELYIPVVDYFLFDTKGDKRGGNGVKFDWTILDQYQFSTPFILSGGIDSEDINEIKSINHPQLYAIDINSKFEKSPGVKDSKMVSEFIQEMKMSLRGRNE